MKNPRRKIVPKKLEGAVALINGEICVFEDNDDMNLYIERLERKRIPYEYIVLRRLTKNVEGTPHDE